MPIKHIDDAPENTELHLTKFISKVTVTDPETKLPVELEIRKDMTTGAMVGIDCSYLEDTDEPVWDPYNKGHQLRIPEDEMAP